MAEQKQIEKDIIERGKHPAYRILDIGLTPGAC